MKGNAIARDYICVCLLLNIFFKEALNENTDQGVLLSAAMALKTAKKKIEINKEIDPAISEKPKS